MKLKIAIIISLICISYNSFAQSSSGIASANMEEELLDQYDDEIKSKKRIKVRNTSSNQQKINYQQRRWKTVKREIQKNKEALGDNRPESSGSSGLFDTIYLKLPSKNRDKVITNN